MDLSGSVCKDKLELKHTENEYAIKFKFKEDFYIMEMYLKPYSNEINIRLFNEKSEEVYFGSKQLSNFELGEYFNKYPFRILSKKIDMENGLAMRTDTINKVTVLVNNFDFNISESIGYFTISLEKKNFLPIESQIEINSKDILFLKDEVENIHLNIEKEKIEKQEIINLIQDKLDFLFRSLNLEYNQKLHSLIKESNVLKNAVFKMDFFTKNFEFMADYQKVYDSSIFGDASKLFHEKCNNLPSPLVFIIKDTDDNVFGGVTYCKLLSSGTYQINNDKVNCDWLFSLNKELTYRPRESKSSFFYDHDDYGPTFGNGNLFMIANECCSNSNSYEMITDFYQVFDKNGMPKINSKENLTGYPNSPQPIHFKVVCYEAYCPKIESKSNGKNDLIISKSTSKLIENDILKTDSSLNVTSQDSTKESLKIIKKDTKKK